MPVRNGDVSLNVIDEGRADAPPILLLHGITSSVRTWDWLVPLLAAGYRVVRLDFRGHGGSDHAPGAYNPQDYVDDAIATLEYIGAPAAVLGHSLGGGAAAAITQQRPDLLRCAVMEDPPLGTVTASDGPPLEGNALLVGFKLMRESIPQLQASGISEADLAGVLAGAPDTTGRGTFGDLLLADGLASMAAGMLTNDASVLDIVLQGGSPEFLDPAVAFGVPSLIVAADPANPDAVARPAAVAHYVSLADDTTSLTVAGAGHLIHDEKASRDTFFATASAFLDAHR